MKKVWKGFAAAVSAAAIAATGFIGVNAANAVEVSVKPSTGTNADMTNNTFNIYQIFNADYSVNSNGKLVIANVSGFATGVSPDFLSKVQAITIGTGDSATHPFEECADAEAVAAVLKDEAKNSNIAKAFAKVAAANKGTAVSSATLPLGYYVIVDETTNEDHGNTTNNFPVLFTNTTKDLATVEIDLKTDIPTIEKKVYEGEDNNNTSGSTGLPAAKADKWNDAADHEIGEVVYFKLNITVGDMTYYDTYNLKAWDELSAGLTFVEDPAPVITSTRTTGLAENWQPTASANGQQVTWDFGDIKAKGFQTGDIITIRYGAKLNENAVVGTEQDGIGNPNEAWLEYSNNPNSTGTGTTEKDKVTVFTYNIDGTKVDVDDENTKLSGAEFILYKMVGTTKYYRNFTANTWNALTSEPTASTESGAYVKTTDQNGKIGDIKGVETGTYYLKEIKAPVGYNLPKDPFTVEVKGYRKAQTGETGTTITVGKETFENMIEVSNGNMTADSQKIEVFTVKVGDYTTANNGAYTIGNAKGTSLPETGGMGTTMLYVAGGAIVLIAGIGMAVALRRRQA